MRLSRTIAIVCAFIFIGMTVMTPVRAEGVATKGEVELGLTGLWDLDPDDDTASYVHLTLGYFLIDGLEAGLTTLQGITATGDRDRMGLFVEYDFLVASTFLPYAGLGTGYIETPQGSTERGAKFMSIFGGVKLTLSQDAALAAQIEFDYADHPVLGDPDARKRRNREINLGLRFYL